MGTREKGCTSCALDNNHYTRSKEKKKKSAREEQVKNSDLAYFPPAATANCIRDIHLQRDAVIGFRYTCARAQCLRVDVN